jgi:5-formaminoimidazole-4-carboxamide-1-(beta)-D-ribofuranosyl 5'-monophosphate synthetase
MSGSCVICATPFDNQNFTFLSLVGTITQQVLYHFSKYLSLMANLSDYIIATLGSHSALQILKGAKDEGLRTLCVCEKGRTYPYKSYRVADEIIEVEHFSDFFNYESQLIEKKAIMIPHPSLINAIGIQAVSDLQVMYYGSKGICQWEFDRNMERQWLADAGLALPKLYNSPEEIDRAVIVKFHGAQGGHGYFIARSPSEFYDRMNEQGNHKKYVIQEYIVGVPVYAHYFYSLLNNELEIMSFDKRYESNADSIGRIAAKDQIDANINTSYTITGNIPIVVRESLLTMFFKIGDAVVESSRKLMTKG